MINFKTYLTESRSAPLYHATSYSKGEQILNDNIMLPGASPEPGIRVKTVSLTRNFTFAVGWLYELDKSSNGMIFEVDQQKLSQRYRIVPYNYFGQKEMGSLRARYKPDTKIDSFSKNYSFYNQHEEAVVGAIKNFKSYATKIFVYDEHSINGSNAILNSGIPVYSYTTKRKIK